jgi:hypothetical protein
MTVPSGLDVHLVCDNYGTRKIPEIRDWLARDPGPTTSSPRPTPGLRDSRTSAGTWLIQEEIRCCVHKSAQALEADIRQWIEYWNENPKPFA